MVVLDNTHLAIEPRPPDEPKLFLLCTIILILALFSTLFEQIKQTNVHEVSKRISHLVNAMNQTNSRYVLVGPMLTRSGGSAAVASSDGDRRSRGSNRTDSVVVMPTIVELQRLMTDVDEDVEELESNSQRDSGDSDIRKASIMESDTESLQRAGVWEDRPRTLVDSDDDALGSSRVSRVSKTEMLIREYRGEDISSESDISDGEYT